MGLKAEAWRHMSIYIWRMGLGFVHTVVSLALKPEWAYMAVRLVLGQAYETVI
jgi:hypothetical protein